MIMNKLVLLETVLKNKQINTMKLFTVLWINSVGYAQDLEAKGRRVWVNLKLECFFHPVLSIEKLFTFRLFFILINKKI